MLQKKDGCGLPFFKESSFKVAKLIFDNPNTTFHLRKIAKTAGLSTTAALSALKEMHKSNMIQINKTSLTMNVQANTDSETYASYKRIFNLYRIEHSDLIPALKEAYKPETIVLFGSFAKGEDAEESDIDILLITQRKTTNMTLERFEKELQRSINLHILSSLNTSEFKNATANGIVLHGYLKVA